MKILLLTLLTLVSIAANSQHKLSGKYVGMLPHSGATTTIEIKDSKFAFNEDNGITQLVGTGKFIVKQDSLFLHFQNTVPRDSSSYIIEFAYGNYSATTATITVNVFEDASKQPFKYAYVTARDNNGKPVLTTIADVTGQANLIIYPNQKINTLDVGAVGYYGAIIPVHKLLGRAATINVRLKHATTVYVPEKNEAYKILKSNNKRLILQQGDEKITFIKQ
jgi:hypothetical protein